MNILDQHVIQTLREQKGWDQTRLAKAAGIHRSVISRVERGLQNDLRLSVALAIAKALDVSVETLLISDLRSESKPAPELEATIAEIVKLPEDIQRQASGILRGYMKTLDL